MSKRADGYTAFMQQILIDDRYALGDLMGSGGMAEVYLAHDEVLNRHVALKVLRDQYAENEEFVERFRREARSAAALNHPNIVSVYDWGRVEDGPYYMAMEYIPGGTLKERILSDSPIDPGKAAEWGSQVARALGFAHERGVIHRDVKPHNILLTESGNAKVTDFGIARAATAATISQSSFVLGTASYMSPEQAMGKSVGPESDLYSLGVVLYEMLTGTLPYRAESPVAIAMKHVIEPPRSPREANPHLSKALDAITLKLLVKEPEDRYASSDELVKDLERVRSGSPPLLATGTEKAEKITVPLPFGKKRQTKRTAIQPLAVAPTEVLGRGGRRRGRLFAPTLAALVFGVILLGSLAWALVQDRGMAEQASSEDASGTEAIEPSTVHVPGLYYASEAESVLAEAGLELGRREEAPSETVAAGVVIEQDPAAETEVEEGTAVDIVVSTGPQRTPAAQVMSTSTSPQQASTTQEIQTSASHVPVAPSAVDKKAENKQQERAERKQEEREEKVENRQEQQEEKAENKREKREEKAENKRAK
jgi:eukaryotic-like serine/threonine-protein kinase